MNIELLLGIVFLILVIAGGAYFYLGHKPAKTVSQIKERKEPVIGPASPKAKEEGGAESEKAPEGAPEVKTSETEASVKEEPKTAEHVQPDLPGHGEFPVEKNGMAPSEEPDVDQVSEIIVRMHAKNSFSANQAMLACQPLQQDFGTPVRVQVRNQITRLWEPIKRGGTYTDMIVSLQLATRSRTVDEAAANSFAAAVNQAVATIDADADVIDVKTVLDQAKAIRVLIQQFGISLSVGISAPLPFTADAVRELADSCGFTVEDGSVQMRDPDSASPWLKLLPHPKKANMLILEMIPALCTPARNPLGALFGVANDIAARQSGEITDPNGTVLDMAAIVTISRQMKMFYEAMSRQGLEPGTRRTKRLFA